MTEPDVLINLSTEIGRATLVSNSDKGKAWILQWVNGAFEASGKVLAYVDQAEVSLVKVLLNNDMIEFREASH